MPKKKNDKSELIQIPAIRVERFDLTIVGTGPLVVNAATNKLVDELRDRRIAKTKPKKEQTEETYNAECAARFNAARYIMADGRDGFPAVTIKYSMVDAVGLIEGVTKVAARAAFFISPDNWLVPITHNAKVPAMREDVVRVGGKAGRGSGTASLSYRPEYLGWSITMPIEFDPTLITAEAIVNLAQRAGHSIGVGEWRPQKGGQWGRFAVGNADEQAEKPRRKRAA
jgi:hypothetical protein